MPQEVRLSDAALLDELMATLCENDEPAVKRAANTLLVGGRGASDAPFPKDEEALELLFFLRTWALSHPGLDFEVIHRDTGES